MHVRFPFLPSSSYPPQNPPRLTAIILLQSQRAHPYLRRNPTSPPHLPDVLKVRRLDPARDYELHARGSVRRYEPDSMA